MKSLVIEVWDSLGITLFDKVKELSFIILSSIVIVEVAKYIFK